MADPTGGMFEARLKLEDETSKPLEGINDRIEKAVKNTDDLRSEFKGLTERLGKMHDKTKKTLSDTNDIGVIGASLLGTEGKGSIKAQFKETESLLNKLSKFMKGGAADATLELADAALVAAAAMAKLHLIMSGMSLLVKFPGILAGSAVEAIKLTGDIEELRHTMQLTNKEAVAMGRSISDTMRMTAANTELVLEAYGALAHEAALGTKGVDTIAEASVYMAEAWRMNVGELVQFNNHLSKMYQIAPSNIMGVASAMDHVARNTRASREELMGLVSGLEQDLMYKIPKNLRSKVMPKLISDITAIAGEWKNMFGDPETVRKGFSKVIDVFDEEGLRLRAVIEGMGGATGAELDKIISGGDAGGFWIAQLKGIQNLKKELGDQKFTQMAGFYAEQMGVTREELMKMSEASIEAFETRMRLAKEEEKSTASIREAWDRAKGVFNTVWQQLENIGKAILIGIGEPILNLIVPALDWLGKTLQYVVNLFKGLDVGEQRVGAIAAIFGTIVVVLKSSVIPALSWIISTVGPALSWIVAKALPAVMGFLVGFALAMAKIVAIAAVVYIAIKALVDFGGAFIDGFMPALEKMWGVVKIIGIVMLAWMAPAVLFIIALIKYWDEFMMALKPGLDEIKKVWKELQVVFNVVGASLAGAFGNAEDASGGFFEAVGEGLKLVIGVIGTVFKAIAFVVSWLLKAIGYMVAAVMLVLTPVIMFLGAIYDMITAIADGIVFLANLIPGVNIATTSNAVDTRGRYSATPMQDGGITTEDGVQAVLHKNEAVMPLEKFPEIVGQTVVMPQEEVVHELQMMRSVMERILRKEGLFGQQ